MTKIKIEQQILNKAKLAAVSQRERNKQDKLHRIKAAALELFIKKGFEQATIRQIAKRAGVAFGTIFLYASNKRDLLFLIYIDDLDELADKAFKDIDANTTLIEQLLCVFEAFYQFFAERPELARDVLREMNFFEEGSQAARFRASIQRIEWRMEQLVIENRKRGMISTSADSHQIALLLFGVYRTEVRRWLRQADLDIEQGLERLRPLLEIVVNGLEPDKAAPNRAHAKRKSKIKSELK